MKQSKIATVVLFCFLIYQLINLSFQIPKCVDITGNDEAIYLHTGLFFNYHIHHDFGPSYNFWYYLLSFFEDTPVELYYLNILAIIWICSISIFVFCYRISRNPFLAAVFSLLFALHPMVIGLAPHVSLFCLMLLLLMINIAFLFKDNLRRAIVYSIGLFLCFCARPEFIIAFIFSIVFIQIYAVKQIRKKTPLPYVFLSFYVLFIFGTLYILKPASTTFNGVDRMYFAFVQHWIMAQGFFDKTVFANTSIYDLLNVKMVHIFGSEKTFVGIITHQPFLVLKHIGFNICISIVMLFDFFQKYFLPTCYFSQHKILLPILFLILMICTTYFLRKEIVFNPTNWKNDAKSLGIIILLFLSGIIISNFIIGLQLHYYLLTFGMLLPGLIYFISTTKQQNKVVSTVCMFLLILMIFFKPNISKNKFSHINMLDACKLPNQKICNYIENKIPKSNKIQLLAIEESLEYYTGKNNFKTLTVCSISTDSNTLIYNFQKNNINMILVDEGLRCFSKNYVDKGLQYILQNPLKYGFTKKITFKNLEHTYLLYKEN